MFCNNCGTQVPDGQKFCSTCGAQLNAGEAPVQSTPQPMTPPQPMAPPQPVVQPPVQPPKKSNTGIIIAIVAVVVAIAVGVTLFFVLGDKDKDNDKDKKSKKEKTTTSQTTTRPEVTEPEYDEDVDINEDFDSNVVDAVDKFWDSVLADDLDGLLGCYPADFYSDLDAEEAEYMQTTLKDFMAEVQEAGLYTWQIEHVQEIGGVDIEAYTVTVTLLLNPKSESEDLTDGVEMIVINYGGEWYAFMDFDF